MGRETGLGYHRRRHKSLEVGNGAGTKTEQTNKRSRLLMSRERVRKCKYPYSSEQLRVASSLGARHGGYCYIDPRKCFPCLGCLAGGSGCRMVSRSGSAQAQGKLLTQPSTENGRCTRWWWWSLRDKTAVDPSRVRPAARDPGFPPSSCKYSCPIVIVGRFRWRRAATDRGWREGGVRDTVTCARYRTLIRRRGDLGISDERWTRFRTIVGFLLCSPREPAEPISRISEENLSCRRSQTSVDVAIRDGLAPPKTVDPDS